MAAAIAVIDRGTQLSFTLEDLMRYHGPGSPGGVAHAFKVMERAWPLLDPEGAPERREISIVTSFGGPGARDAFELVTRAVTEQRYVLDAGLERPELGLTRERFVFRLGYRGRTATLVLRDGYVTEEFIELARRQGRSAAEEARLDTLKLEMADRVMGAAAEDVYDELAG